MASCSCSCRLVTFALVFFLAIDDSFPAFTYPSSQCSGYRAISASTLRRKDISNGISIGRCTSGTRRRNQWINDRCLHATPATVSPTSFAAVPDDGDTGSGGGRNSYEEGLLLEAYNSWRQQYNKGNYDPVRYNDFRLNFIKLTAANAAELKNARETGKPDPIPMILNEYGDYSPEEYKILLNGRDKEGSSGSSWDGGQSESMSPQGTVGRSRGSTSSNNTPYSAYSSEGPAEQERIRQVYQAWCFTSGRPYDESRLDIFAFNLKVVESYSRETGKKAELNRYADLSPEEYEAAIINRGDDYAVNGPAATEKDPQGFSLSSPMSPPQPAKGVDTNGSYLDTLSNSMAKSIEPANGTEKSPDEDNATVERERIRSAYREWCLKNGKEYEESRLDTFAYNFRSVEQYCKETGRTVTLNMYADLNPDEYSRKIQADGSANYASSTSKSNSYLDNLQNSPTVPLSSRGSYLDTLSSGNSSPKPPVEDRVREIYRDWCQYYGKVPDEGRLQRFATNLIALEKHHLETGEELTLNEFADQDEVDYQRQVNAQEMQREAVEQEEAVRRQAEEARLEAERQKLEIEQKRVEAARVENERRRAEESFLQEERRRVEEARIEEQRRAEEGRRREEEVRLQAERKMAEDARLKAELRQDERRHTEAADGFLKEPLIQADWKAVDQKILLENDPTKEVKQSLQEEKLETEFRLYERRRREEAASLEAELSDNGLEEQKNELADSNGDIYNGDINEKVKEGIEESSPLALPRNSYMDAVARTWVDRSAYLESLQEGNYGVITNKSGSKSRGVSEKTNRSEKRPSQPLIDSIWNFMNAPPGNRGGKTASEQYAISLIQQADEMISDAIKSTQIDEEELRHLKEAVDALRRRNTDEFAADQARTQAKEWQKIQEGLEKEARKSRERREFEERAAEEARRRAQILEREERQAEQEQRRKARDIDSGFIKQQNSDGGRYPFSLFPGPFQVNENTGKSKYVASPPKVPPPYEKKEPAFSIFGARDAASFKPKSSFTKPVVVEKKESWFDVIFDFFGTNRRQEEPGQGTITLEPAKRTSVFDLFVSPDMIAPREPGRGSITIEETKKPSIFSFFANFGKDTMIDPERRKRVQEYEIRRRSRQEKLSWLEAGRSRILEQTDKRLSRKEARRLQRELEELAMGNFSASAQQLEIPQLAKWTRTPDGRITGYITESTRKYRMGTKITTSRIKGQKVKAGITVTTVSGSQYRLGLPNADAVAERSTDGRGTLPRRRNSRPTPLGFLFGGMLGDSDVPDLVEWTQNEDGTLTGFVNNKEGFEDGTQITTSPVTPGAKMGMIVQTRGGSKYRLLKQKQL